MRLGLQTIEAAGQAGGQAPRRHRIEDRPRSDQDLADPVALGRDQKLTRLALEPVQIGPGAHGAVQRLIRTDEADRHGVCAVLCGDQQGMEYGHDGPS